MAKIFAFNSTNVINYAICIFLVSQDYDFLYYQVYDWASNKNDDRLEAVDQMYSWYMVNDCNSIILSVKRCNEREYFPGP